MTTINIKKGTPILLYVDNTLVGEASCTKPGEYTVDFKPCGLGGRRFIKKYPTTRFHDGIEYNQWVIWELTL